MIDRRMKTSTGHALSAAAWLDAHYLAGQPEYEAVLRSAGFQAAETLALPAADRAQWRDLADPASPGYLLRQPDLYWREAAVLVTGYKSYSAACMSRLRSTATGTCACCVRGGLSTHAWFVLTQLLGYPDVREVERSWAEWGNRADVPVEK